MISIPNSIYIQITGTGPTQESQKNGIYQSYGSLMGLVDAGGSPYLGRPATPFSDTFPFRTVGKWDPEIIDGEATGSLIPSGVVWTRHQGLFVPKLSESEPGNIEVINGVVFIDGVQQ